MNTPLSPQSPALTEGGFQLTHTELHEHTTRLADTLHAQGLRTVATLLDNGAAWVLLDRALAALPGSSNEARVIDVDDVLPPVGERGLPFPMR